ncbi:unnamed protein product [Nyctereutes procyonoides]|uniref:(raccoon dog) hypothetical protein n=1 Tax=Nyctereutes procyonoides TaxID=34880 RepID=A0A811XUT6_NYCPR|nr:unnamed protein product [Nyctereutes procyonoides]
MALCPPPSRVPLSLGFCSFSFFMDAQPRDCASFLLPVLQGPGAGAPTRPGASAPCPSCALPRPAAPSPRPPRAPGGRVGRSSSPSRTLEPLAERAVSPPSPLRGLDAPPLRRHLCAALPAASSDDALPGTPPRPRGPRSRSGHPLRPLCGRPLVPLGRGVGVGGAGGVAAANQTSRPCPTKESATGARGAARRRRRPPLVRPWSARAPGLAALRPLPAGQAQAPSCGEGSPRRPRPCHAPHPRGAPSRHTSPAGSRSLPLPGPPPNPPPAPPRRPPPPAPSRVLPSPPPRTPPSRPRPGASGRPGCANPGRGPPPDAELGPARPRPLTSGFA